MIGPMRSPVSPPRASVNLPRRRRALAVGEWPESSTLKAATPKGAIPLQFFIPLADFDPGVYTLEVQALDENAAWGIIQNVGFLVR